MVDASIMIRRFRSKMIIIEEVLSRECIPTATNEEEK